jgi:hypothetical protein
MKQLIRKTLLVLFGGVFMSTAAWADTKLVGSETNDNGFWAGELSEIYDIAPNKTLKLEFTSYIKDTGWSVWEAWVSQFWDLQEKNVFVRADGFGWQVEGYNTNDVDNPWFSYNSTNYPAGDDFHDALQEASVVYTFKRINAEVIITQEVTKGANTYKHEFVCFFGDGTRNIAVQLATEASHIIIDNSKTTITDSEIPAVTGTLLGCLSQRGRFGAGQRKDFTLGADGSMTLHFKNYSSKLGVWNNWVLELQKGTDYLDMRCDNWGWGAYWNAASCTQSDGYWDDFAEKMDGADVVMSITRNGSNLLIVATHTPKVGDAFTQTYDYTNDALASGDVLVRLLTDCSYIDLLSTSAENYQTINAYGWSTYSSDKALDFSTPIDGLTVYAVTGHTESALKLSEVTSKVPANTGLLLKGTAGTCYTIPLADSGTAPAINLLKAGTGALVAPETDKTKYALSVEGGVACFKKITAAREIPAGKAYLEFNETIEAREFFALDEETTGVADVRVKMADGRSEYFNLAGQRVVQPTRGLYIVNGKKVIIK